MAVTVQQLLNDAKRLVTRLREHDNEADTTISQAQTLSNNLEAMKEYHTEIQHLNGIAHQRPRSALILNIQQENRHIRELQQENRELRAMLEEHQSVIDIIMNKYRQQVVKFEKTSHAEGAWVKRDKSQELVKRNEKISEMAAVMQKAIEIDDENFSKEMEVLDRLTNENKLLRELLEIGKTRQKSLATKLNLQRTDECIQTEL